MTPAIVFGFCLCVLAIGYCAWACWRSYSNRYERQERRHARWQIRHGDEDYWRARYDEWNAR